MKMDKWISMVNWMIYNKLLLKWVMTKWKKILNNLEKFIPENKINTLMINNSLPMRKIKLNKNNDSILLLYILKFILKKYSVKIEKKRKYKSHINKSFILFYWFSCVISSCPTSFTNSCGWVYLLFLYFLRDWYTITKIIKSKNLM